MNLGLTLFVLGKFLRAEREFGFPLAQKFAAIVNEWGKKSASAWLMTAPLLDI